MWLKECKGETKQLGASVGPSLGSTCTFLVMNMEKKKGSWWVLFRQIRNNRILSFWQIDIIFVIVTWLIRCVFFPMHLYYGEISVFFFFGIRNFLCMETPWVFVVFVINNNILKKILSNYCLEQLLVIL